MGVAPDEIKMMMGMREDIAAIKALLSTMANTNNVANEALQSARSAHHRIDEIKNADFKDIKDNQTWLWRTAITSFVTAFIAVIGFLGSLLFKK